MSIWSKKSSRPHVDEYGRSPLWYLAANGDFVGVLTALSAGADPNMTDNAGYTPLHIAVHNGHLDVMKHLISVSDSANIADKHGNNPLWTAISISPKDRKTQIITLLVAAGSDPDHKNIYGKSPREVAVMLGTGLEELFSRV